MNEEKIKKICKAGNILVFTDGTKFIVSQSGLAESISEEYEDDKFYMFDDLEGISPFLNFETLRIENCIYTNKDKIKDPYCISYFHGILERVYRPLKYEKIFNNAIDEDIKMSNDEEIKLSKLIIERKKEEEEF